MRQKPINTGRLSARNLAANPFRTAGLVLVVAALSFALFGGAVLSASLTNGMYSLKERLGADLAVVPLEHEADYEGIILSGEPSRFYFSNTVQQQIQQ
ncbi:MAG: ABC transporter permease, partial [Oscillospiraceae bacterium]